MTRKPAGPKNGERKAIAEKLKEWRKRNGLSQPQAAAKLGVPLSTLRQWERSRRSPRGLARAALLERIGKP